WTVLLRPPPRGPCDEQRSFEIRQQRDKSRLASGEDLTVPPTSLRPATVATTMWPSWATVGRQSSRCVCHLGGFFYAAITTRFFDRSRKPADSGVRQGCALVRSAKQPPPPGGSCAVRSDVALLSERRAGLSRGSRPTGLVWL